MREEGLKKPCAEGDEEMKSLVLVDGVHGIPSAVQPDLVVVSGNNWREQVEFLLGKTGDAYVFLHETADPDLLLKLVEDYRGNMAVYCTCPVSPVFRSRFSRVVSRRTPPRQLPRQGYPPVSRCEAALESLREARYTRYR